MKGFTAILLLLIGSVVATLVPEPVCPPEQEDDWTIEQLLVHEDCTKFYKCTFGKPVEYRCYGDLYFNIETWQCDWRHNVDCTGRVDPAETTTTPTNTTTTPTTIPTTTTTTTIPTSTATATTPTTTTTTPTPTTTTRTTTTITPTTTPTTTTTTPTTTTTTPTTTTTTPTTTTTTTTTTTEAPATEAEMEFLPNGCPVDPHIHWLLPHETECNLFYYCVWGQKVLRECPATLHFNRVLQVCDWPADAGCTTALFKHRHLRKTSLESDVEVTLKL